MEEVSFFDVEKYNYDNNHDLVENQTYTKGQFHRVNKYDKGQLPEPVVKVESRDDGITRPMMK